MSEIVKAVLGVEECLMMGIRQLEDLSPGERVPVLILPIEDGEVGPFEKWMVEFLEGNLYALPLEIRTKSARERWREVANARIAAAISRLFVEVESED